MRYQVRGIEKTAQGHKSVVNIIISEGIGINYQKISYPGDLQVSRDDVILFLSEKLGVYKENIMIPDHIKLEQKR